MARIKEKEAICGRPVDEECGLPGKCSMLGHWLSNNKPRIMCRWCAFASSEPAELKHHILNWHPLVGIVAYPGN